MFEALRYTVYIFLISRTNICYENSLEAPYQSAYIFLFQNIDKNTQLHILKAQVLVPYNGDYGIWKGASNDYPHHLFSRKNKKDLNFRASESWLDKWILTIYLSVDRYYNLIIPQPAQYVNIFFVNTQKKTDSSQMRSVSVDCQALLMIISQI